MEKECTATTPGQYLNKTGWPNKAFKIKCRAAFQSGWMGLFMEVSVRLGRAAGLGWQPPPSGWVGLIALHPVTLDPS